MNKTYYNINIADYLLYTPQPLVEVVQANSVDDQRLILTLSYSQTPFNCTLYETTPFNSIQGFPQFCQVKTQKYFQKSAEYKLNMADYILTRLKRIYWIVHCMELGGFSNDFIIYHI